MVHIISGLSTGGAERALYNLLYGGLADRFNSHVVSLIDEGTMGPQIRALDIPITSLGMRGGLPPVSGVSKLRKVVREFRPDVIQGWMYHGNLAATLAKTLAQRQPRLVWNIRQSLYGLVHEKPMTRNIIRGNRFFSSGPNALLYNSRLSRSQHEAFGLISTNGMVIPNGIDLQMFCFSNEARKRVRSKLGISRDSQVVGHVARLHPMKDHPGFLRAAVNLAYRNTEMHFLLSGRNVSMENDTLKQLIPSEVRNRFHLLGERSDVPELMSAMDVFCQSSWSEAFPNVLGEAMSTGIPCVATDVGDSAIVIGDTGVIVPPRDENSLAEGIENLLKMPSEKRRALGDSARFRIKTNYSLGTIVDKYASLYENLITKREVC